jgi:hypothetical protein
MKMEQIECPKTLAYKLQMPENHSEESIQHSEHAESLKSRRSGLPQYLKVFETKCTQNICIGGLYNRMCFYEHSAYEASQPSTKPHDITPP